MTFHALGGSLPSDAQIMTVLVAVVGIVTAITKLSEPFVAATFKGLKGNPAASDSLFTPVMRAISAVCAVGLLVLGSLAPEVFNLVAVGIGVGAGSVGTYSLISKTSSGAVTTTPVTFPPAPATAASTPAPAASEASTA